MIFKNKMAHQPEKKMDYSNYVVLNNENGSGYCSECDIKFENIRMHCIYVHKVDPMKLGKNTVRKISSFLLFFFFIL